MKTQTNTPTLALREQAVKKGLISFFCLLITLNCMAQPSNKCLSFNGINSHVVFVDNDLQMNYDNNIAVGAWVNWSSKANAGPNALIISSVDTITNNGQFWLQHNADNSGFQFTLQTDLLNKITVNSITNPVEGNWYYVAGVFDGSNVNIYVNGNLEGTAPIIVGQNMNAYDSAFKMTIGAASNLSNQFNGLLDEISIWNQPLTTHQFQDMMCKRLNPGSKGLVAYWNMDSLNNDSILNLIPDSDGDTEFSGACKNVSLVYNGAPVGSNSTFLSGPGPYVYVNTTHGDSLFIDSLNFITSGIYIYEINAVPTNSLLPVGVTPLCTPYYYGIYIPDYTSGTFKVVYYYNTTGCGAHKQAAITSTVFLTRNSQSSFNWVIDDAEYDQFNHAFSVKLQGGQNENMLANATGGLGIENNIGKMMNVHTAVPNPFSSGFNISVNCKNNTVLKSRLLSVDGKQVSEGMHTCTSGENQINFENLNTIANGIYFLNVTDEAGHSANIKVVKN